MIEFLLLVLGMLALILLAVVLAGPNSWWIFGSGLSLREVFDAILGTDEDDQ